MLSASSIGKENQLLTIHKVHTYRTEWNECLGSGICEDYVKTLKVRHKHQRSADTDLMHVR